ncbi:hypothetical protein MMC26_004266 [Xylographa opegraphella]|nr:hypothetical protein [Xylographa opegraphella]
MEPPLKRPRLDNPHEILLQKRARNDLRLKSRFESIFEKFGKDFTGVGDEIDFQTGQIVVNNGHLTTMQGELDAEGLANEEDELATETPSELDPGKQSRRNGAMFTKSQEAEDNSAETVLEGPYGPEVACIGSSIAAAIKMEDGSSYDSTVHGELLIARNILSQLSCLGPHIRKSIANVQQSANTSKVVSIETDDLTVDPVWRVPVLVRPQFGMPSEEPPQKQSSIPEEARPVSPARSPSPAGHSLWSLDMPVNRSSPYEIAGARESKNNHNFLRKGRRMPRLLDKEEPMLRTLGTATNSTYQEPKTHFSDMAGKGQEQRRQSVEVSASEDSQFSSAKSSSRFASLPKNGEPEISTPIIGTISTTVDIPTSPAKIISAEMTACQPLSSHKSQGKRQGRQRRAEHARTAYQKLSE